MREKFQCQDEISVRVFFFDTINANLSDILTYNYSNAIEKTIELIKKNEIWKAIKRCKLNDVSKFNDILNRVLKILMNKLISHLKSLF